MYQAHRGIDNVTKPILQSIRMNPLFPKKKHALFCDRCHLLNNNMSLPKNEPLYAKKNLRFQKIYLSLPSVRGEIRTNDALLIDTHLTEGVWKTKFGIVRS